MTYHQMVMYSRLMVRFHQKVRSPLSRRLTSGWKTVPIGTALRVLIVKRALANRLDKEVFKDGYDPGTEEYFVELDRRIKEKEPDLFDDLDAGADDLDTDDTDDRRGKNVVAPVGGNESNAISEPVVARLI